MNNALTELYETIYPELSAGLAAFPAVSLPLFCRVPDGYTETATRLMVVGQETRGWWQQGAHGVAALMDFYARTRYKLGLRGPITRAAYELFNALNPDGPKKAFIWSNLVRVEQNARRPSPAVEDFVSRFELLPREIDISQPDAVVFFAGPRYRARLSATFLGVSLELTAPKISRVVHPNLPRASFYTYHPGYLIRGHWEVIGHLAGLVRNDRNTSPET